jgi:hypothetical protein
MRTHFLWIFSGALILWPSFSRAESPLQASNIGNPNVSVIGWFQSEAGHRQKNADTAEAFSLKEAEIGIQSIVDTYAKADFFYLRS